MSIVPTENTSAPEIDLSKLVIKPLDKKISRAAFCCGNEKIDNFCRNNAKRQNDVNRIRVYDAFYEDSLVGYYYLVASSNLADHISEEALKKFERVKVAPCVYLGMIGVHQDFQGNGIGKVLMLDAMQTTLRVAELIGVYALTLEAIDKKTADLYAKWGFQYFTEGEMMMFIPIGTIKDLLG